MSKPELLKSEDINITELKNICQKYIEFVNDDYQEDNDFTQLIFEAALESVFGDDIWKFVNDRI